eukprot:CAMPEP_0197244656 /NCGR_PEP_ID=MMETSP1429-20130617/9711_1 /TAXON_ID=49237 /ORGANISM="Chaetoceros  sp., Strain UNC1202" /LENGTH=488 /DNA_ID=CAMNT_0042705049 /DNA_START=44 /DNA_END=1510 /DNA_ORIENTATION=+
MTDDRKRSIMLNIEKISGAILPNTAQYRSLDWILSKDIDINSCMKDMSILQRYVLAVFFDSTNGQRWIKNSGWMGNENECTSWHGILCDDNMDVIGISLDANAVGGTLPRELTELHAIRTISLYNNIIGGSIPSGVNKLRNLEVVDLEKNKLTGTVDFRDFISSSKSGSLKSLRLSFNQFYGTISRSVGSLESLEDLWIAGNSFTGTVPKEMGALHDLETLFMYKNLLTGEFLDSLTSLASLEVLDASFNTFRDTIPESIGNLKYIKDIILQSAGINGSIPAEIGQLRELRKLVVPGNDISGQIPEEMNGLHQMTFLQMNDNQITGFIPELDLPVLLSLDLSNNRIGGTIHSSVFHLQSLRYLYLENNLIRGTIPFDFGRSLSLEDIYLRDNLLTGTIPDVVRPGVLSSISELLLNRNNLHGPVPDGICNLRSTTFGSLVNLWADCETNTEGHINNVCASGCCTFCTAGKNGQKHFLRRRKHVARNVL